MWPRKNFPCSQNCYLCLETSRDYPVCDPSCRIPMHSFTLHSHTSGTVARPATGAGRWWLGCPASVQSSGFPAVVLVLEYTVSNLHVQMSSCRYFVTSPWHPNWSLYSYSLPLSRYRCWYGISTMNKLTSIKIYYFRAVFVDLSIYNYSALFIVVITFQNFKFQLL